MRRDADILKIFQFELSLLEEGSYRRSPRAPWRASYVFEDSPTCLNFNDAARPHPCTECPLMEFVPAPFRGESAPCRFIPLTEAGETVDYLYRAGTQMELEDSKRPLPVGCTSRSNGCQKRKQTRIGQGQQIRRTNLRSWRRLENSVCSKSDLGGKP